MRMTREDATTVHPITLPIIAPTGEGRLATGLPLLLCVSVVVIVGGLVVSQKGGTKESTCSSTCIGGVVERDYRII